MTRTIRRFQLPSPAEDGTIEILMPPYRRVLCVEELAGLPYLVAVVDDDQAPVLHVVIVRGTHQEAPMHDGRGSNPGPYPMHFLGALGPTYFFWKGAK